ncbi:MAG: ribonuclease J [Patescibacteria group bacterium]|nr:ribonuclease J [Patescibacteria group bacterium]
MSLRFVALSGTTNVAENMYVYEYEDDMIVVDCGVGFPESDMYGVDLVIPDFTYIKERRSKLRAIVITHGHEDHMGAVPFLVREIGEIPIYCTRLVAGFLQNKFEEAGIKSNYVNVFDPDKDEIDLGIFRIVPFRISHSVPDTVGFCIETPDGNIFHIADFKFDWSPVDGKPFDVAKVATLASSGVLALASDCLGSTNPGYTKSEREIEKQILSIVEGAKRQVLFTTISSNISRIQQAINVAILTDRKISLIGRSIDSKFKIAQKLGYVNSPKNLIIPLHEIIKLPEKKRMYIISGSYGQPTSALYKVALGEHKTIIVGKDDVVIFSSDPGPPGSKDSIDFVVDRLIELSADVHYYDMQEDLHVSGHGCVKDIEMLFGLVKPKYYIPIGGTIRQMHAAKDIAVRMGIAESNVFELGEGGVIEFSNGIGHQKESINTKKILVDGLGIGDVGNVVLRDRQTMATDGIAIILLKIDSTSGKLVEVPEIISRGFVFEVKMKKILDKAAKRLKAYLEKKEYRNNYIIKSSATDYLEKFFFSQTGRRPMILPLVVEI